MTKKLWADELEDAELEKLKRWNCVYYERSERCCNLTKHTCKGSTCGKWDVGLHPDGLGHWIKMDVPR